MNATIVFLLLPDIVLHKNLSTADRISRVPYSANAPEITTLAIGGSGSSIRVMSCRTNAVKPDSPPQRRILTIFIRIYRIESFWQKLSFLRPASSKMH